MARKDGLEGSLLTYDAGTMWDDGAHDDVTMIRIAYDVFGIAVVNFSYRDGTKTAAALVHGKNSDSREINLEEIPLLEDEYITSVRAHTGYCVRRIEFQTNKRLIARGANTHDPKLIYEVPVTFRSSDNKKIVGFHGRSGHYLLHMIGVYWAPI